MENFNTLDNEYGASKGTLIGYTVGFALSIFLTIFAYLLVTQHLFSTPFVASVVMMLGVVQLIVQLVFFLHLSPKSRGRWNLLAFMFTVIIVTILVIGTLWVMRNLTDRMMLPMRGDGSISVQNAY